MLYISSAQKIETDAGKDTTHASLAFVANRFLNLAYAAEVEAGKIDFPDIYRSPVAGQYVLPRKADVDSPPIQHLCVSSWNQARHLSIASKNFFHLSWEQESIYNPGHTQLFGTNMLETLKTYDKIWACADFVHHALAKHGISSTTFPTPISAPSQNSDNFLLLEKMLYDIQPNIFSPYFYHTDGRPMLVATDECLNNDGGRLLDIIHKKQSGDTKIKVFITQGNMGDKRKNILSVLFGFSLFAAEYEHAYLIVKTSPSTRSTILSELGPHVTKDLRWGWWGCKNIFIAPAYFTDETQCAFYDIADFYLCCPVAEGQNIPLQESVQHHCYPIAPLHTAMKEYLDSSLISEVCSVKKPLDSLHYCNAPLDSYIGYVSDYMDIADACQKAVDTEECERKKRIAILQNEFLEKYTETALIEKCNEELDS